MYLFISHLFDSETHSFVCSICELCVNICKHCVCGCVVKATCLACSNVRRLCFIILNYFTLLTSSPWEREGVCFCLFHSTCFLRKTWNITTASGWHCNCLRATTGTLLSNVTGAVIFLNIGLPSSCDYPKMYSLLTLINFSVPKTAGMLCGAIAVMLIMHTVCSITHFGLW